MVPQGCSIGAANDDSDRGRSSRRSLLARWALVPRQSRGRRSRAQARSRGSTARSRFRSDPRERSESLRDEWGVAHISAASAEDLFFAQGYVARAGSSVADGDLAADRGRTPCRDRRAAGGAARSPCAAAEVSRSDRTTAELTAYHPDARRLMTAFVSGVNAYIAEQKDRLPVEFVLTGIVPEPWTIDSLTLRQITFGDATNELLLARASPRSVSRRRTAAGIRIPRTTSTVPQGLDVGSISREAINSPRRAAGARTAVAKCSRRIAVWPASAPLTSSSLHRRTWQQQLGRERRALDDWETGSRQRSAPRSLAAVAPLHLPPEGARMERHRRHRSRRFSASRSDTTTTSPGD